jgi:hypothetical protein
MFDTLSLPGLEVVEHRDIPRSVKEQSVVMSGYMRPSQSARVTHINIRTVQRVLALH